MVQLKEIWEKSNQ
jgi:hypothetical protein